MRKIVSILIFAFITVATGLLIGTQLPRTAPAAVLERPEKTTIISPETAETDVGVPVRLVISKIGVDAAVESVGLDAEERMDVPKRVENVAWYNLGMRPGQKGNAVIAGHYDTVTGAPAVFYDLTQVAPGDEISVTDINNKTYRYTVTDIQVYPYDRFPLQEVFGAQTTARLNLITCEGSFDSVTRNYSHRTVVYSELLE